MECGKGTKRGRGGERRKGGELKYAKVEWATFMFCATGLFMHTGKNHTDR